MSNIRSRLLSGRVKKLTGYNLDGTRYEYIGLGQTEPDLGTTSVDGAVLVGSTSTNQRIWSTLLTAGTSTVRISSTLNATSQTGALVITGGASVAKSIYVGEDLFVNRDLYLNGSLVVSTATIQAYVVPPTVILAGTDTAVNTSTGLVTIWSTSDLESVARRGSTTTQAVTILNEVESFSTDTGALRVAGGVGIGGNLTVGGEIVAQKLTIEYTTVTTTLVTTDDIIQTSNTTRAQDTTTGALVVGGGVGIGKNLIVGEDLRVYSSATVQQNLLVQGTITAIGGFVGVNATRIFENTTTVVVSDTTGTIATVKILVADNTVTQFTSTLTEFFNQVRFHGTQTAATTGSASVIFDGGVSVGGDLFVTQDLYARGLKVLTTATLGGLGVGVIYAGTDTVVDFNTGVVTVWNTSTLQSVTERGNFTDRQILITNSSASTSVSSGALVVGGGAGFSGDIWVGGNIYSNNQEVITTGTVNQYSNQTTVSAGTDTAVSTSTGNIVIWNLSTLQSVTDKGFTTTNLVRISNTTNADATNTGALVVSGGAGIGKNLYVGGSIFDPRIEGTFTFITSKTNEVPFNIVANNLYPGVGLIKLTSPSPDIKLNQTGETPGFNTINFEFNGTPKLAFGRRSDNSFYITRNNGGWIDSTFIIDYNTGQVFIGSQEPTTTTDSGALVVSGGAAIGQDLRVAGTIYASAAEVLTTATLGTYANQTFVYAGTDTAVNTNTGVITVWNTSTLQSITNRGSVTTNAVRITNTTSSTGTNFGALVVNGGVGVGENLYVKGVISAEGGFLGLNANSIYQNTSSVTVTDTGTVRNVTITVANQQTTKFYNTLTDFLTLVNFNNSVLILGTQTSTSSQTGALVVNGGVGIGGSLNVAGNINANSISSNNSPVITIDNINQYTTINVGTDTVVSTATGITTIWNNSTLETVTERGNSTPYSIYINSSTNTLSTSSGALVVQGGVGIGKDLRIGGNLLVNEVLQVNSTQSSTSSVTGAVTVAGGVGVGENLYVKGVISAEGGFLGLNANKIYETTSSVTVSDTGSNSIISIIVADQTSTIFSSNDIHFYKTVNFENNVNFNGPTTQIYSTNTVYTDNLINIHIPSAGTGTDHTWLSDDGKDIGLILHYYDTQDRDGFLGLANDTKYLEWYSDGLESNGVFTGTEYGIFKTGGIRLVNTTTATSTNTGALVVNGGVGIGENLYVGGRIQIASTSYIGTGTILTSLDLVAVTTTATYITNDPTSQPGLATIANTTTVYGTYNFGTVSDITVFGDYNTGTNTGFYSINDAAGSPGYIAYIGFSNVIEFNRVVCNINYTQNSGHTVYIDIYNYTLAQWDSFTTYSGSPGWIQFALGIIDTRPYISSGNVTVRFYHSSTGNTAHRTWIDYVALEKSIVGGQGPRGATGATGAQGQQGLTTSTTSTFIFFNTQDSSSTITGAVVMYGGAGIGGNLYVGGKLYQGGNEVLTTSSVNQYANQTTIIAGTDTAINTSTGSITIWNTSTLQSVTDRGNSTTNVIRILNTSEAVSLTSAALVVDGGLSVGLDLRVGGKLYAGNLEVVTTATVDQSLNQTLQTITDRGNSTTNPIITPAVYGTGSNNLTLAGLATDVATGQYLNVRSYSTDTVIVSAGPSTSSERTIIIGNRIRNNLQITSDPNNQSPINVNVQGTSTLWTWAFNKDGTTKLSSYTLTADVGLPGQSLQTDGAGQTYWSSNPGYSGSRGYVGSSGAGFQGSVGYIGSVGYTGSIGYTGSYGPVGYTGSTSGYIGSTGYIGSVGYTGSTGAGYTGSEGYVGSVGYTGSEGIGYTGSQGITGFIGSVGGPGYIGSRGADGTSVNILGSVSTYTNLPGYPSSYGGSPGSGYITTDTGHLWVWSGSSWVDVGEIRGPKGDIGYQGSAGAGYTGSQSYTGSQGYVGSQGPKGDTGSLEIWVKISANYTASDNQRLIADTSGGSFTIALPQNPQIGYYVVVTDGYLWNTNPVLIDGNGSTIEGINDIISLDITGITVEFIWSGSTWQVTATLGVRGSIGFTGSTGAFAAIGFTGSQAQLDTLTGSLSPGPGYSNQIDVGYPNYRFRNLYVTNAYTTSTYAWNSYADNLYVKNTLQVTSNTISLGTGTISISNTGTFLVNNQPITSSGGGSGSGVSESQARAISAAMSIVLGM